MGDNEEEYPFRFMNTPASLQLLASSEVALMLWQYEYSNMNSKGISLCVRVFLKLKATCSCDGMLVNIPSRFKADIDQKIVTIHAEMRNWIECLKKYKLIDEDPRGDFSTLFKHIVVNASGRIVYKATAVNILNSGDLSDDLVSYRMACLFCLEDQIKRIWPSVAEDVRLNEITDRNDEYDLEFYWTRRMQSSDDSTHEADFSDLCMLYWPAFENFWKLLSQQKRESQVISSLRKQDHRMTQISLPTLNRIHAEKVLKVAQMDLVNFFISSNYEYLPHLPQMYQVWSTIENTDLEEKKLYFSKILRDLWRQVFGVFTDEPRPNYAQCDQINDVLLQIWSSAEDELKDYVSNTHLWYFIKILVAFPVSTNVFCCYGHDAIFMSDLLKRSKNLDKEQFWQNRWRTLALLVKPSCLERLMRLCLPNDDAIEVFKNEVADFKDLFRSLIKEGFYSHLKDYLLFCSKDVKQFHRLGKNMLESNLDVIFPHDDDKFAKFDRFIGELFSNVEKDADEFKTQIISSTKSLKCLFSARHADGTRLSDFGSITSRFVNNDEQKLHLVKSKLWAAWKMENGYVYDYQLYADQWQCFLEWCTVDRKELTAFKSSLDLNRVFFVRMGQYFNVKNHYSNLNHYNHTAGEVLEFLDAVLKWYFTNEEGVRNFKLDIIKNHKQHYDFCTKLESKDDRDRYLMNELLRWFLRW